MAFEELKNLVVVVGLFVINTFHSIFELLIYILELEEIQNKPNFFSLDKIKKEEEESNHKNKNETNSNQRLFFSTNFTLPFIDFFHLQSLFFYFFQKIKIQKNRTLLVELETFYNCLHNIATLERQPSFEQQQSAKSAQKKKIFFCFSFENEMKDSKKKKEKNSLFYGSMNCNHFYFQKALN